MCRTYWHSDALGSFGLENLPAHSPFACTMQRRRPGGLNPTLLEGSPRNAAGEYAACMGLEEDVDAQAAMRADGLAWKERLRFPEVHVGLARRSPSFGQESEKALRAEQEPQPTVLDWLAGWLCCCSKREGH